jgi:hypothetical protein
MPNGDVSALATEQMKPQMNADERRQSQMLLDRRPRALICGSLSGYSIG